MARVGTPPGRRWHEAIQAGWPSIATTGLPGCDSLFSRVGGGEPARPPAGRLALGGQYQPVALAVPVPSSGWSTRVGLVHLSRPRVRKRADTGGNRARIGTRPTRGRSTRWPLGGP